jgi:hypothetical protein
MICTKLLVPTLAAGVTLALAPLNPRTPAAGPGAVIAMHQRLFRALDAGDASLARSFATAHENSIGQADCVLYLPGEDGKLARHEGADAAGAALAAWAEASARAGGSFETKITFARDDCRSTDPSYAILEFERSHTAGGETTVRHYRSTSLVRYVDGAWKLFHWNVAPR